MSYTNEQHQWLADVQRKRELEKLQRLQEKYSVMPDYSKMNLHDELQARFDIDEMKQLQQKYGSSLQIPVQSMPIATPVLQTTYSEASQSKSQQDSSDNWQNKALKAMQNIADLTEKGSIAFANGITLGNFDEAIGVIGGTVGATKAYLNNQNLRDGYKQGYQTVRDDIRNNNKFSIEHPILNTVMESAGAFASPVKFFRYSKTAPLTIQNNLNKYNAIANGLVYGYGTGQDNWQNYAKQIAVGLAGNLGGHYAAKQSFGRAASPAVRNCFNTLNGKIAEYSVDGIQNQYDYYNKF